MKRDWLINIRKRKRLTQQKVATRAFIDRSYYSHIESGKRNPSLTVAKSIAGVLNFDPLKFFKDIQIDNTPENTKHDIYEFFNNMETGNVLYLYNKFNSYINNAVTFSLIGVWRNSPCLIIDKAETFIQIQENLKKFLSNNDINNYIHHINEIEILKESPESLYPLEGLSTKIEEYSSIFIWCHVNRNHPNDWVFKLQNDLNSKDLILNNKKIISVHSYDASIATAQSYIELMRKVPYLLTDYEIFDSPLYYASEKTTIFPSLYLQEDK